LWRLTGVTQFLATDKASTKSAQALALSAGLRSKLDGG
jgi:hypothetical protein